MEKLIWSSNDYDIFEVGLEALYEISSFVISQNYTRHSKRFLSKKDFREIEYVFNEELEFLKFSILYIVRDKRRKLIGSIRVFKWDKTLITPMQKLFNISPNELIDNSINSNYWHIGRFAIDSLCGIKTVTIFKQLMILAVDPIMKDNNSYMLAETDTKLLKVMNALGFETSKLSKPIIYLSSETVPIFATKAGISPFYKRCYPLIVQKGHKMKPTNSLIIRFKRQKYTFVS